MCRLIDARNVGEVGDDSSGSSLSSPVVTIDLSGGDEGSMTVRRQYDFDDDDLSLSVALSSSLSIFFVSHYLSYRRHDSALKPNKLTGQNLTKNEVRSFDVSSRTASHTNVRLMFNEWWEVIRL